jgi:hypothetical protein
MWRHWYARIFLTIAAVVGGLTLVAPAFAGCRAATEPMLDAPVVAVEHPDSGPALKAKKRPVLSKMSAVAVLDQEDCEGDDDSGDDAFPPPEAERTDAHRPRPAAAVAREPKRFRAAREHRTPPERPPTRA